MKIFECLKNQKPAQLNFDILPDGIFTLEQDGRIVDVNDKVLKLYNATRFDFLGHYFSDFVEDGTSVLNKIMQSSTFMCAKAIKKDENPNVVLEINTNRDPETNKVYVIVRNVTQKQKEQTSINQRYLTSQKIIDEKNEFLLSSSGSILSSLVSITGFSRALLDGRAGALSDKQEKYLNLINTNSRDLSYDLEKLFSLFRLESKKVEYNMKNFDLVSLLKTIDRVYQKDFTDKKVIFNLDHSALSQRDCYLDNEIIEYVLRCIMDIFLRFANLGKCSLNVGHPPLDFLKSREFSANITQDIEKYALFEAKITDLVFSQDELENIFDAYYQGATKRPIGLKASLNILKIYITDFGGDIWVYSKPDFGTMFTFVLPLKRDF